MAGPSFITNFRPKGALGSTLLQMTPTTSTWVQLASNPASEVAISNTCGGTLQVARSSTPGSNIFNLANGQIYFFFVQGNTNELWVNTATASPTAIGMDIRNFSGALQNMS